MQKLWLAVLWLVVLPFHSCSDKCGDFSVSYSNLTSDDTRYTFFQNPFPPGRGHLLIQDQTQYENSIGFRGMDRPSINFGQYTLVAGETTIPSCGSVASKAFTSACELYHAKIYVSVDACQAVVSIRYLFLIDKTNRPVVCDVYYKDRVISN